MRDHRRLRAFELADELVLLVYSITKSFPKEELFGLSNQLRRAAISIASNIVEGCGRRTEADYLRFLDMAHGSAREVKYQLSVAQRLGYSDAMAPTGGAGVSPGPGGLAEGGADGTRYQYATAARNTPTRIRAPTRNPTASMVNVSTSAL